MNTVEAHYLNKRYGKVEALRGVDLSVQRGELFGIIGPDGAGKTTLFRILNTLILADRGTANVLGLDVVKDYKKIRKLIGYMPGRFSLYPDLTVEENLNFFARVFNTSIQENYALMEDIYKKLEPFKDRPAGKLSGGMKQKLALCCTLIHKPEVLFLDEPTTGVDPVSRKEFWDMLRKLQQQGISILVSTPYMDEANLCDRIALIKDGVFLQKGSPEAIKQRYTDLLFAVSGSYMSRLLKDIRKSSVVRTCFAFGDVHHVRVRLREGDRLAQEEQASRTIREELEAMGHQDIRIESIKPGIEDCFMALMD